MALTNVLVNKQELLVTVQKNAQEHDEIYKEAVEAWRVQIVKYHNKQIRHIKKHGEEDANAAMAIPRQPISNATEYKRAIKMIEMSTMDELELTAQQFNQLVMDEWSWSGNFRTMASNLTGKLY